MVSGGSNTCNVLPRRRDEIKFILLLFPANLRSRRPREEIWEIELSASRGEGGNARSLRVSLTRDVNGYIEIKPMTANTNRCESYASSESMQDSRTDGSIP